jgi:hypothetical protein
LYENAAFETISLDTDGQTIVNIDVPVPVFIKVQFRKEIGSLNEDYSAEPDGAIVYTQTLSLPIHGRDASKSNQISRMSFSFT